MKTPILFILFLLFATALFAQPTAIRALADLPVDEDDRSELSLSGSWLRSLTKGEDGKSKGFLETLHFLSIPETEGTSIRQLSRQLEGEGYELMTSFRSNGSAGHVLIKENGDFISDLVAIFRGEENKLTAITVGGRFRWEDLNDVDIDVDGWDKVKSKE